MDERGQAEMKKRKKNIDYEIHIQTEKGLAVGMSCHLREENLQVEIAAELCEPISVSQKSLPDITS